MVFSIEFSPEMAMQIGDKIWKNECGGSIEGLTNWNKGENFPSLGIGHFIWYCSGKEEGFKETFPDLLHFLEQNGASLPLWLKETKGCPWNSREEFYQEIRSPNMNSLRQLLFETRGLQAEFIANRLERSFKNMIEKCFEQDKNKVEVLFGKLTRDADGLYALIDYLNFKGEGTSPTETYQGQGWGLLQVLQKMPETSENLLVDFVETAKALLEQRVKNSPPERNEKRWLKGWFNRLETYLS